MAFSLKRRPGVAVVEIYGVIGTRVKDSAYSRLFESIARNKRYGALLLDIDSPGGSATGSDLLYHSLKRVGETKPVVAYVRGLGASGGYYLCCAASRVVALPTALIGSIGVIHVRPILEQLLGKIGVEFSILKEGRLKDMSGFWRHPTDEESTKFQSLLTEMYDTFVTVVAEGRNLEQSRVRELATGELYTARQGHEAGLVDELADFYRAVDIAAELGNARPTPKWVRPRRPLSVRMFGRDSSNLDLLAGEASRLLAGGVYFLEPSYLLGDYLNS